MNLRHLIVIFALSAGMPLMAETPVPPGGPRDYKTLEADLESPMLFRQRFLLEQRRRGGPRPDVIQDLLAVGLRVNSPLWSNFVLESCQAGLVDCGRYLEAAREWASKQPAEFRNSTDSALKSITQEAEFQAMTPKQRREFYIRALQKGAVYDEKSRFYFDASDAARRAIREGVTDLFDDVVASIREHPRMTSLKADLAMARTLEARDPDGELLRLVGLGAEADVRWIKEAHEACLRRGAAPTVPDAELSQAHLALDALRRRNAPGVVNDLRKIFQIYVEDSPGLARRIAATKPTEDTERKRPQLCESSPFGLMGSHLIETIGDLGDRDLERRALGGRTLWDQVNEAEQKLIKERKLLRGAMIASNLQ